jgi:enoyl-CoA hydratase/carnithine racemase
VKFEEYSKQFKHAKMRREGGILEVTLHTNDGSLQWSTDAHDELSSVFRSVSEDRDNKVVILTGTGEDFTGPRANENTRTLRKHPTPEEWDVLFFGGRRLEESLLNIEVPVIAALNGSPFRHMELALLSDIIIAAETALFEDPGHFRTGDLTPGDSIHVVCSNLLGHNRARYFQLMGQTFTAAEAKNLGLIAEVLPKEQVLARAWEIARYLSQKPLLMLRYTRVIFTQEIKKQLQDLLPLGMALEGLAVCSEGSTYPRRP